MSDSRKRWRGLLALVVDAVQHGSRAVERVQKETAETPFKILEQVPPIATPARAAHVIHDAYVSGVHGAIRLVATVVGKAAEVAFDVAEARADEASKHENFTDPGREFPRD